MKAWIPEPVEQQPDPCQYCSVWSGAIQEHDGTCDDLSIEQLRAKIAAEALEAVALEFELSPHNTKAKMARHFNNAYVDKLRVRAAELRDQ